MIQDRCLSLPWCSILPVPNQKQYLTMNPGKEKTLGLIAIVIIVVNMDIIVINALSQYNAMVLTITCRKTARAVVCRVGPRARNSHPAVIENCALATKLLEGM